MEDNKKEITVNQVAGKLKKQEAISIVCILLSMLLGFTCIGIGKALIVNNPNASMGFGWVLGAQLFGVIFSISLFSFIIIRIKAWTVTLKSLD